ncbi:MAG: energy transducer TonB [Microscillaceae bacterium]|nr:energy transducer TonB [Microscillaceae bacterium]
MEPKKNPKIDLNGKRTPFLLFGLVISLSLVIMAFEWKFYDSLETIDLGSLQEEQTEMIEIPITEMPPPPPPVLQQPEIVEVPEEEEIQEQVQMELDVEVEEETVPDVPVKINAPPPPPPKEEREDEIFLVVEEGAAPEGGLPKFYEYVSKNLVYPKQAKKLGVEGTVVIEMVVDKDGSLTDFKVLKGIGAGCDEEAIRIIKSSPKWKPGKQRGRPVRQRMTVPLRFKLT